MSGSLSALGSERGSFANDPLRLPGYDVGIRPLLLATFWINVLSLALPILTLQVYDRILPNPGTGTFAVLVVGVCVAVFLEAVLRLTRSYIFLQNGASYEHRLSCRAMDCVLNARLDLARSIGIGEHLNRLASVRSLKEFRSGYALTVYAELLVVPVFLGVIAFLNVKLAIVAAVVLTVFTVASAASGMLTRKALAARESTNNMRINFLIEVLDRILSVKAFAQERVLARRYDALQAASAQANLAVARHRSTLVNLGALGSNAMVAAIVVAGALAVLDGELSSGALVATLVLSARTMAPVQRALALLARYQDYRIARDQVRDICTTPQQVSAPSGSKRPRDRDGRIAVSGLTFRLRGVDVADGLDLSLVRGECVAISGGVAGQRSLLLALLAGVYPLTEGSILIDGCPIEEYPGDEVARHVGLVRANAPIFRGTIRDNITAFGQHDIERAREVSGLLGIDADVAALPSGFDTQLTGAASDNVPPGLARRIAISRALAPKPRIILFDNAEGALDREGYARLYSMFARLRGQVTMVLVTDDENMRTLADRTLNLSGGKLVEGNFVDMTNWAATRKRLSR